MVNLKSATRFFECLLSCMFEQTIIYFDICFKVHEVGESSHDEALRCNKSYKEWPFKG